MKLNHLNLIVSNVSEATAFFENYFAFQCTEIKGDHLLAVLKGTDSFTLTLMKSKKEPVVYPDAFHLGFMLATEEKVLETYQKLSIGGIELGQEPRKIRDTFGFYFKFESIMIEVAVLPAMSILD